MHYFIDGYNMLFRLIPHRHDLQSQREAFINDLNQKISVVNLNVSLVFDSTFQIGGRSRTHYNALEILYSAEGETADEYILDELKHIRQPRQEIVVTSDKKLAWHARHYSAKTESVEEFIQWLNKSYKNKLKQLKNSFSTQSSKKLHPSIPLPENPIILPEKTPPLDITNHNDYEQIFENRWQQLQIEEQKQKELRHLHSSKHQSRQPKKKKDPFQPPPSSPVQASTDMERWLKTFEKHISDPDFYSKY